MSQTAPNVHVSMSTGSEGLDITLYMRIPTGRSFSLDRAQKLAFDLVHRLSSPEPAEEASAEPAAEPAEEAPAEPAAEPAAEDAAEPAEGNSGRRRRGRPAKTEEVAQPAPQEETASASGGRRRRSRSAEPASEDASAGQEEKPAAEASAPLTVADMLSACSKASAKVGVEAVKAVGVSFGVKSVTEIEEGRRQAFLDALKAVEEGF